MPKFVTSHHKQLIIVDFAYTMDQNIQKNYALYIQISKSTTSQTIHTNLLEIIQNLCLSFTKCIKDFENFTFKFLELPFHNPLKEK